NGCRCGSTLRQRYDEVGLPCNSTMGAPCPTCRYAISRPRTRRRCFWYGNAAEFVFVMFASPVVTDYECLRAALPALDGVALGVFAFLGSTSSSRSPAGGRQTTPACDEGRATVSAPCQKTLDR